jgi:hypothetical protein
MFVNVIYMIYCDVSANKADFLKKLQIVFIQI